MNNTDINMVKSTIEMDELLTECFQECFDGKDFNTSHACIRECIDFNMSTQDSKVHLFAN